MLKTLTALEEAELVAACRDRDERAWARLYALTAPTVRVFVRRNAGPETDVDDLCQQVFIELFSSIGRFRGDARISTWLYRIAANVSAKAWRSAGRHSRKISALAEARVAAPRTASTPGDAYDARHLVEAVDEVLQGLKPAFRTVWLLSTVEGLAPPEIADIVETRVGTVRSQLTKARHLVMEGLGRRGFGPTSSAAALRALESFAWTTTEEEAS